MTTGPAVLSRTITNAYNETRQDEQYIGDLNNLNAFDIALSGTLAPQDRGDYYDFRVTSTNGTKTYVTMSSLEETSASAKSSSSSSSTSSSNGTSKTGSLTSLVTSGQLQYQLLSQTGQVIASSNPDSGQAYKAYQALTSGTNLELSPGTYTIKVSPGTTAQPDTSYDYIFSLRAGSSPVNPSSPLTDAEEFQTTAEAATENLDDSSSGWIPSVLLSASSTSTSLFDTLDSYDGGIDSAENSSSSSSSSSSYTLQQDTLLGGIVDETA